MVLFSDYRRGMLMWSWGCCEIPYNLVHAAQEQEPWNLFVKKEWRLNRSFRLWHEKSYISSSFLVIWERESKWKRERGWKNIPSAGKSAPCDKNEVWAYMYDLVNIWCVIQKVRMQALENHELVLENHDASFRVIKLQLKQQQLGILLVFDIWAFTMLLDLIFQDFSLQLWGRGT